MAARTAEHCAAEIEVHTQGQGKGFNLSIVTVVRSHCYPESSQSAPASILKSGSQTFGNAHLSFEHSAVRRPPSLLGQPQSSTSAQAPACQATFATDRACSLGKDIKSPDVLDTSPQKHLHIPESKSPDVQKCEQLKRAGSQEPPTPSVVKMKEAEKLRQLWKNPDPTDAWDHITNTMSDYDHTMVEGWKDELNNLLIFVSNAYSFIDIY